MERISRRLAIGRALATGGLAVLVGPDQPLSAVNAQETGHSGLRLSSSWSKPWGGKAPSQAALQRLFGKVSTGKLDSKPYPKLELVRGVNYLMPLDRALQVIGSRVESRNGIATPGFPNRSMYSVSLSGAFGEGFNRMVLVLDSGNQVVSVQFVDQAPGGPNRGPGNGLAASQTQVNLTPNWKVYNFIHLTQRLSTSGQVRQGIARVARKTPAVYQVESQFFSGGRLKERVRWFVPQPIADVLHHCASLKPKGLSTGTLGGASGL